MPDLDALTAALDDRDDLRLAVLFGSQATGDAQPTSDIDLGVLPHDGASPRLSILQAELSRAAGGTVDLVDMESAPPLLRFKIAQRGKPLLMRDRADWVRFRRRAMVDWYDWQPTARRMWAQYRRSLRETTSG
ncbi:MAG: nucleotidyltransferase domain-containing protein [Acidobacteriota bacterium]